MSNNTFIKAVEIQGRIFEIEFESKGYGHNDAFHDAILAEGAFRKGSGKTWYRRIRWNDHTGDVKRDEMFLNRNGYRLMGLSDSVSNQHDSQHNSANL